MKYIYLERLFRHLSLFRKIRLYREALHFCLDTKTKQKGQGLGNSPKRESNFLNISQTLHFLDLFLTKIRFPFLTVNHPRPILKPRSLIQASDRNKQNLTIQNNVAFKTFAKEQEGRSTVAKVLLRRALRGFSDEFLDTFYGEKVSCLDGIESNWKLLKTFSLSLGRVIALLVSLLFSYLTVTPAYGQEPVGLGGGINNFKRFPKVKYDISSYKIEKLTIGQKLPEGLLDLDLWLVYPDGRDEVVKLSQFSNKKLIIFDFWATWCSPCISSIEEFIESNHILHEDILFLPVHVDFDYKALPFLVERNWKLPCLIGESAFKLQKYFYDQVAAGGAVWGIDGVFRSLSYENTNNILRIPNILQGDNVVLDTYEQHPLIIAN